MISKLDRLGRSQVEVINRLADLQEKGIHTRNLDGLINTRGLGRLSPLHIGLLTGLAEVDRSLIQECTKESVEHRRKTGGSLGGRPKTSEKNERLALHLRSEGRSPTGRFVIRRVYLSPRFNRSSRVRRSRHESGDQLLRLRTGNKTSIADCENLGKLC